MAEIIYADFNKKEKVIPSDLWRASNNSVAGLISEAETKVERDVVDEHAAEPIKRIEDIEKISQYLIANNRYRDNMIFIVGINFGLRISDLRVLRFCDLINDDFTFKRTFPIVEKKTKNTRKHKKNRYITINSAVIEAVTLFLKHSDGVKLDDYMFQSESNHGKDAGKPMHRNSFEYLLKGINKDLHLGIHMSTHTLRKTFAYHQMAMCNNDPRKLMLLSKMLGHSSLVITLDYIGLTQEEIENAYLGLNLGGKNNYINCDIGESLQLVV